MLLLLLATVTAYPNFTYCSVSDAAAKRNHYSAVFPTDKDARPDWIRGFRLSLPAGSGPPLPDPTCTTHSSRSTAERALRDAEFSDQLKSLTIVDTHWAPR